MRARTYPLAAVEERWLQTDQMLEMVSKWLGTVSRPGVRVGPRLPADPLSTPLPIRIPPAPV